MAAILLGWNPDVRNDWSRNYPTAVAVAAVTGVLRARWSVDRQHTIERGTDAWLILQGRQCGIIGHGIVTSAPYQDADDADPSELAIYIDVVFDVLLAQGEQLPSEVLSERAAGVPWIQVHRGSCMLPAEQERCLRVLWAEHVQPAQADPPAPVPGTLPEGAISRVAANRYERDPQARRACIAHHGTSCAACGFSFETVYGDQGKGFIHVHHIVPVSEVGHDYELDPLIDLVPLCPNCHAMVHRGRSTDPLTPAELRRLIAQQSGHLQGSVLSSRELTAEADAARILGTIAGE